MHHVIVVLVSILFAVWSPAGPSVPDRWRSWPVARVFPASVPGASPSGARVTYVLTGVAPEAPCRTAFHPGALPERPACVTALRATYADSTSTFVATVGIAVLTGHGEQAMSGTSRPPTVRPVAFPGGPAERFHELQYFTGVVVASHGRYLVATAAGHADGRTYRPGDKAGSRLRGIARQLAVEVHRGLTA